MSVVLKIKSGSELYRIVLDEEKLNFDGIKEAVQATQPKASFVVKYLDDEDELCTLCPSTFSDFVCNASDKDGKKMVRVEVFEDNAMCNTSAQSAASSCGAQVPLQNNLFSFMDKGLAMLQTFQHSGFLSQSHRHGHFHVIKSLKFTLAHLHRNGLLTATSFTALLLNSLPNIMCVLVEDSEKVNWKFGKLLPKMQAHLQDLQALLASTAGMEHCAQFVADWLEQKIPPSEACLQVLPALLSLPFSSQVKFLEEVFTKIESGLQRKLQQLEGKFSWMPFCPMVHDCVTCDGCNVSPIQGLRFKCKTCPNHDLCADCYTRKDGVQDGNCSAHEFEMISLPKFGPVGKLASMFKGCGKGKGKGWKGFCKAKGKGCECEDFQKALPPTRPCAREGCTFAATWHPTHCCAGCAQKGMHGGRCERQEFATQAHTPDEEKHVEEEERTSILEGCAKAKGKGKGKGKGKEKGWKGCCKAKGKGYECEDFQKALPPTRPCAREGCTFAATWHPPHCCAGCAHKGIHGGRCERLVFVTQAHTLGEEKHVEEEEDNNFEVVESASVELPFSVSGHGEECHDDAKHVC